MASWENYKNMMDIWKCNRQLPNALDALESLPFILLDKVLHNLAKVGSILKLNLTYFASGIRGKTEQRSSTFDSCVEEKTLW